MAAYDPASAQAIYDQIQEATGGLVLRLRENVAGRLQTINDTVTTLQSKIGGTIGLLADSISEVAQRVEAKIQGSVNSKVGELYGQLSTIGIGFPSYDAVKYFQATGDSFGAFGLARPMATGSTGAGLVPPLPIPVRGGGVSPIYPQPLPSAGGTAPVPIGGQVPGQVPAPPYPVTPLPQPGSPNPWQSCPPGTIPTPYGCVDPCTLDAFRHTPACQDRGQPAGGPPTGDDTGDGTGTDTLPAGSDGSCPEGYVTSTETSYAGTVDVGPNWMQRPGSPPKDQPPEVSPAAPPAPFSWCSPQATHGWETNYTGEAPGFEGDTGVMSPWLKLDSTPPGVAAQAACIPRCSMGPDGFDLWVHVPAGWSLYVLGSGGQVVAANHQPPGFVRIPTGMCGSFNPYGPPGPSPGAGGGAGGGVCVPAPGTGVGQCKPATLPACGPDLNGVIPAIQVRDDDACGDLDKIADKLTEGSKALSDFIGMKSDATGQNSLATGIIKAITGHTDPVVPGLVNRAVAFLQRMLDKANNGLDCDKQSMLVAQTMRAAFGMFGGWFGLVPEQLLIKLDQIANTVCHVKMPSTVDAHRAWLADQISDAVWECWVKAAGDRPTEQKQVRDGERERPNIEQVIRLFLREKITEETRNKLLRKQGVINDDDRERFIALAEQFPEFQDVIRMTRRDVFNEDLVKMGDLDFGFDTNYLNSEQAKAYGKAIGITDDLAKYFWRAHWQIPAFTMLREMVFRLPKDKFPEGIGFDKKDMEKALFADGWAPGYIKRMIEIAYLPINRTDFSSMYFTNVIDDDELKVRYQTVGYNEQDADTLVAHMKVRKRLFNLSKAGFPSMAQLVRLYSQCQIDESTLQNGIEKWATNDDQIQHALEAADIRRDVWLLKQSVATIQKQYRFGLIDEQGATEALNEAGMDPQCVPGFVRRLKKQKQQQMKQVPAAKLCKWRELGIIGEREQLEALIRIHYSGDDALRMVEECNAVISEKARKAAEAAAKKQAAADKATAKAKKKPATSTSP